MIDLRVKLPGFVKEVVHRVSVVLVKRSKVTRFPLEAGEKR